AKSFALVAADILFPPVLNAERDKPVPRSEARRFSRVSICRRIESASSNDLRDVSMSCGKRFHSFLASFFCVFTCFFDSCLCDIFYSSLFFCVCCLHSLVTLL